MEASSHPRVLCVDDEPHVLDALSRQLRRGFAVWTAESGDRGLEILSSDGPFAVVVSDMRMPGMDGATFLAQVRARAQDTVRVLLTGQSDLESTVRAVNTGNIFRFLCKPCPPDALKEALDAAVAQHRLVTAERDLLEKTLHGSVKMMGDVLALANPAAFGRAKRARARASALAELLQRDDRWQVEVAAMLSQVGCVTLPPATAEKLYHGQPLEPAERALVDRLPTVGGQLVGGIPRLEEVRDILKYHGKHFDGGGVPAGDVRGASIPWGARCVKLVLDLDVLETQGMDPGLAINTLRGRSGWYDPELLDALGTLVGSGSPVTEVREVQLEYVESGMVFAEDVRGRNGVLLIARGQEVTESLLERIRSVGENGVVRERVKVIVTK